MPVTVNRRESDVKRIVCTYCGGTDEVSLKAMSVFCPHCHKRLILEDYKIDSYYCVREFFTCGDVVVERKGHVVAPIKAASLTVKGKVQGSVVALGLVTISKTGSFKGEIAAPALNLEKGAVVDAFLRIGVGEE